MGMFMLINLFLMSAKVMPEIVDFPRAITVNRCGTHTQRRSHHRVVGGTEVKHGLYPWMVSIYENDGNGFDHICGGSILNENWILTAAHCIDFVNNTSKYRVYAGLHKLSQRHASTVQKIKVAISRRFHVAISPEIKGLIVAQFKASIAIISKIILHEDYDDETYENDIALLKTEKPINIAGSRGYVNGICLPRSETDPTGYAKVIGWGHTFEDGENSNTLKAAVVPIIPRDLCNGAYDDYPEDESDEVTETMICAGMTKRDACQNDSGGPLIQTNNNGAAVVIGVVSHGAGCGETYYPGVYTKVSSYKQWIQENVSNN